MKGEVRSKDVTDAELKRTFLKAQRNKKARLCFGPPKRQILQVN